MVAGSDAAPSKGRLQKRKTNPLQIVKSSLQRTAGPYMPCVDGSELARAIASCIDHRPLHRSPNPFRYRVPSLRVA